jgi:hypothetical protein
MGSFNGLVKCPQQYQNFPLLANKQQQTTMALNNASCLYCNQPTFLSSECTAKPAEDNSTNWSQHLEH